MGHRKITGIKRKESMMTSNTHKYHYHTTSTS